MMDRSFLKLTRYDASGLAVIRMDQVANIEDLPASVSDHGKNDLLELGQRTRIRTTTGDLFVVNESAEKILDLIASVMQRLHKEKTRVLPKADYDDAVSKLTAVEEIARYHNDPSCSDDVVGLARAILSLIEEG